MIRNTGGGGTAAPALNCYLNLMSIEDLPDDSAAPRDRSTQPILEGVRAAGYDGVQFIAPVTSEERTLCARLGLGACSLGRVNAPEEAGPLAERFSAEGMECASIHVGWGLEDDDLAARLIESVLEASAKSGVPLYVETHRATIFQDPWRTAQFAKRFPELRFNGDFSHWYTGLEFVYGGFETKLAFIQPVLDRVRFIHGRIGNPGCMQVDIGDGDETAHPYVAHFRALWTASFRGFVSAAAPGDRILFVPELLSPRIYYGRVFPDASGELREESDRWAQSLVLRRIAAECYAAAKVQPLQ